MNSKAIDHYADEIEKYIEDLHKWLDDEKRRELWFSIFYFYQEKRKLRREHNRQRLALNNLKTEKFNECRESLSSDRRATEKVNKDLMNEISSWELWDDVLNQFDKDHAEYVRMAKDFKDEKIQQNVDAKYNADIS